MAKTDKASSPQQTPAEADFSPVLFTTLLATFIFALVVYVIYMAVPAGTINPETSFAFVFSKKEANPENQEKVAYLSILFLLLPLTWFLNRKIRWIPPRYKVASWIFTVVFVLTIWTGEYFFYFQAIPGAPLVLFFLGLALYALQKKNQLNLETIQKYNLSNKGYWALAFAYIFIHFWVRLVPENDPYLMHNHSEAMLFANWQTFSGKTLTVDLFHQYGLYPEFLSIVWRLFGKFTILGYTVTLSLLVVIYHYCLFYFGSKQFKSRLLGFFVVAGTIHFTSFFYSTFMDERSYYDPYFQYVGVRTFFPGLLLYFLSKHPENPNLKRTVFYTIILSFAPFWNLDSGIVCVGSWFIYLQTQEKSYVRPVIISALSLLFSGMVVTGYLFFKCSHLPDFLSLIRYQTQFYGLGFFMLPMPLLHSWLIYAFITVFAAGVYFNKPSPERGLILSLSVLSAGTFAYYQGRSHSAVFTAIIFPAALLLGLGLDRILSQRTLPKPVAVWLYSMTIAVSALALIFSTINSGAAFRSPKFRNLFTDTAKKLPIANSVSFLNAHTSPGKTVWILSNHASAYHVLSQTQSPLRSSLIETFKRTEIQSLVQHLLQQETVFADSSVLNTNTPETNLLLNQILKESLTENFTKVESDPEDRLSLWRRRH
ncbi:MAG: conserved rane protein of unknown function [Verrucomicrobiales bacterium]|nr:conserved rane protein of unknown function [Verrucomicrobiales bacterium]